MRPMSSFMVKVKSIITDATQVPQEFMSQLKTGTQTLRSAIMR